MDCTISETQEKNSKCHVSWRYVTAVIGCFAMFNSFAMRTHLSVTMVAMVNSTTKIIQSTDCNMNNTTIIEHHRGPFDWDSPKQGILFGGFYWGYILPQVLGGSMAEKHGASKIVIIGGLLATVATAIGPWAATVDVWFFFTTRVLCGLGLSVYTPCLHTLIAKWTPPNERSRLSSFVYAGGQIGIIVAMLVSGVLCQHAPNGGWPWPFYVFAMTSGLWLILWVIFIFNSPSEHRWISKYEKDLLENKLKICISNEKPSPPYKAIMTSKPFYSLMWAHFGQNWGYYTLLTQIPTYMYDILQFNLQKNGLLSAVPYFFLMMFGFTCSVIADHLIKSNKLGATYVRRTFQSIASYGPALSLLVLTFLKCKAMAIYVALVLAVSINGAVYAGIQCNHLDLSPNFAGTLLGITNTLACIPGIVSPYITGIVTNNSNTHESWSIIFYITIGILVVTATQFAIFGSGELQTWNNLDNKMHDSKVPPQKTAAIDIDSNDKLQH